MLSSFILRLIEKFEATGDTSDARHERSGQEPWVVVEEKIQEVDQYFKENPETSLRKASGELGIARESLRKIVREKLDLFAYKIQVNQLLQPHDI